MLNALLPPLSLTHAGLQRRFQFLCNDWIKGSKARCEIKAGSGADGQAAGRVTYKVCVATSDVRGAGTDADVSMVLFCEKGDTGQRRLESSANDFERGKVREQALWWRWW